MALNLFKPAQRQARLVKIFAYGDPGAGKTTLGLTFPKVALIDLEGGSAFYGDRFNFMVFTDKRYDRIMAALREIEQDGGKTVETLVIDPITLVYQVLQDAAMLAVENRNKRNAEKYGRTYNPGEDALTVREWGIIKRQYSAFMTTLINLPCNVVMVARHKDIFETDKAGNSTKIGVKPDAEKSTEYLADMVVRMTFENGKRVAVIEKDRTGLFQREQRIPDLSFAQFETFLLGTTKYAAPVKIMTETEAAAGTAGLFDEETTHAPKKWNDMSVVEKIAFTENSIKGYNDELAALGLGVATPPTFGVKDVDGRVSYAKQLKAAVADAKAKQPAPDNTADVPDDDAAR